MIESAKAVDGAIEVVVAGEPAPILLSWIWLRDHCPCTTCYDGSTNQRLVSLRDAITMGGPRSVEVGDDGALEVAWPDDGHTSRYDATLIRSAGEVTSSWLSVRESWDASRFEDFEPTVEHASFIHESAALAAGLRHIARFGFCLVDGTPPTAEATRQAAERIGYVRQSVFGGMWGFQADGERADTAYTAGELGPHTDSTYSIDAPGLQVLHCIHLDATGGDSLLVDGLRVAEELESRNPTWVETLATVPVTGQYIEDGIHLKATRPALRYDEHHRLVQISFNSGDRAPMRLPEPKMCAFYEALAAFERIAGQPDLQHTFRLKPGRMLVFDNWRVLHARRAFTGDRRVVGCYLNREDFESRLRVT